MPQTALYVRDLTSDEVSFCSICYTILLALFKLNLKQQCLAADREPKLK